MRFSGSKSKGEKAPLDASSKRVASNGLNRERRNKFVLMNFGLGFLAFLGLGLWFLETGRFARLEILFAALSAMPVGLAVFAQKAGRLKQAQAAMTAMLALAITAAGIVFTEASQASMLALTILPAMALTYEWKYGTALGSILSAMGIAAIFAAAGSINPYNLAAVGGLWAISSTFCLQAKMKFERYRAQLLAERARFTLLSEAGSELVTRHDRTGATLYVSEASKAIFGMSPEDLLKTGLCEKAHLQDRIKMLKSISEAADTGSEQFCELRIRSKNASPLIWKWVSMRCVPTRDAVLDEWVIIAVTRDITDAKQAAERAEAAEDAYEDTLDAHHELLDSIGHHIRRPVAALIDQCDALDSKNASHQLISATAYQALTSLDNLVDTSRLDMGIYGVSQGQFSAKCVVDDAMATALLSPLAQRSRITLDVPEALPHIHGDRNAVTRVFAALLGAAFTSSGSSKPLTFKALQHGPCINFALDNVGADLTGPARNGLQIADRLVALLGGRLETIKHANEGQSFRVTLPTSARPSRRAGDIKNTIPAGDEIAGRQVQVQSSTKKSADLNTKNEGASRARISA